MYFHSSFLANQIRPLIQVCLISLTLTIPNRSSNKHGRSGNKTQQCPMSSNNNHNNGGFCFQSLVFISFTICTFPEKSCQNWLTSKLFIFAIEGDWNLKMEVLWFADSCWAIWSFFAWTFHSGSTPTQMITPGLWIWIRFGLMLGLSLAEFYDFIYIEIWLYLLTSVDYLGNTNHNHKQ